jgi:large subunit ribosomal protein L15
MSLHEINKGIHKHTKPRRLGRGVGTGTGKTAGKGHKGAKARAGYFALSIFQGGAMPLVRRVPKRGFTNSFAVTVASINVGDLSELFNEGETISPESLRETGVLKRRYDVLKVLGDGDITKKLTVSAHRFSASAREKLEKAGCTVQVIAGPTPVEEKKAAAKQAKKSAGKT